MLTTGSASVEILGVYYVPGMDEELRQALRTIALSTNCHWDQNVPWAKYVDRCVPRVLFDILVHAPDGAFNADDFTQLVPSPLGEDAQQAAFNEALLSFDGQQILERKHGCADGLQAGRMSFYFHYYDPCRPMQWTYGEFDCPPVSLVPAHLWNLLPYETTSDQSSVA